jgi:hypothetical protein
MGSVQGYSSSKGLVVKQAPYESLFPGLCAHLGAIDLIDRARKRQQDETLVF